ncbi:hypothetical protein ACFYVL_28265 [Streptomyces sp. NPDC004111]|uniref:hypothetical protein n=1 Tax=Streptomyces sp. NPDC004111 TaxID=3364690 RepID=UPI0036BB6FA0
METGEQLITIAAVLLGALTTYATTYMMERTRNKHALLTRWDTSKLTAYETFVDSVRACIYLSVELYEDTTRIRSSPKSQTELNLELIELVRSRGRAFERVMLLGGDDVVEAAHQLSAAALKVDWQAQGKTEGTLDDWRSVNRAVFNEINEFHEAARVDLGVKGSVKGERHPQRDLLLPPARRNEDTAS